MYGIGIDTGGTCTDAIIYDLDEKKVLTSCKSATTHNKLEVGIENSIKKLPRELVDKAEFLSLSTTLATNACVEGKGGRVCLIFIGVKEQTVRETYMQYGFESMEFIRFIEGDISRKIEPEWDKLESMLPEILNDYESIAISQIMPRENDGAYEKEAKRRILERKNIPVVCAYEIFKDFNAIKRGAGALLNARLIPVMQDFFDAIHKVLKTQDINIPFFIMRSDGSLVSEEYSMQYPVETLLCGPTASAKGAMELMNSEHAIVVDMGGTTSDIALIEDGQPIMNDEGVKVASWETFVKGIEIDTFALGGDTWISYLNGELMLGNRRVIPISSLAVEYPQILAELEYLSTRPHGSAKAMYEHLVLMKEIDETSDHYDDREKKICALLKEGPLSIRQLADGVGQDVFTLKTDRLETEGILLRSGFTPTDAMVIKGDRIDESVDGKAAELAVKFIANSTGIIEQNISEMTYDLVKERLYCNLVRILWQHEKTNVPKKTKEAMSEYIMDYAKEAFWASKEKSERFFRNNFKTDAILLGIGAPIHVFLDDVAKLMGTTGRVSEYSGVSNALGAMLGDVCVYENITIRADYTYESAKGLEIPEGAEAAFIIYGPQVIVKFFMEEAIEEAKKIGQMLAEEKAYKCGAKSIYHVSYKEKMNASNLNYGGDVVLGAQVVTCVKGKLL